jgi:hypothetical protein
MFKFFIEILILKYFFLNFVFIFIFKTPQKIEKKRAFLGWKPECPGENHPTQKCSYCKIVLQLGIFVEEFKLQKPWYNYLGQRWQLA